MAGKLIVTNTQGEQEYPVGAAPITIGREPWCTIILNDPLISRTHAKIEIVNGRLTLNDLGSSNGTFVGDSRITSHPLTPGDIIHIGESTLTFVTDPSSAAAPPVPEFEVEASVESLHDSIMLRMKSTGRISGEEQREGTMFFILYHIGKVVASAATLDEMIEKAMELIFTVINAERGLVMFKDPATAQLLPKSVYHRKYGVIPARDIRISSTIVNRVMTDKMAVITSDARQDPRFAAGLSIMQMNIRSAICVPLWDEGAVFGILYLDNLVAAHRFTNDDLSLMSAIGNLIAIRLKQDRLYENLRQETLRRANLSKYHSPDVVELLMSQNENSDLNLTEKEVTVLFADIVGSTPLAEQLDPQSFAATLNDFFEFTSAAIFAHKGHVNKFIGDCVMAIYNAPLDSERHAGDAIRTAMTMLADVETRKRDAKRPFRYDIRIGINTGKALVGTVGTSNRREYTVVGDVVNTASRLSKLDPPNQIVISENTRKAAGESIRTENIGEIRLKGKERAIRAYQVFRT